MRLGEALSRTRTETAEEPLLRPGSARMAERTQGRASSDADRNPDVANAFVDAKIGFDTPIYGE